MSTERIIELEHEISDLRRQILLLREANQAQSRTITRLQIDSKWATTRSFAVRRLVDLTTDEGRGRQLIPSSR